MADDVTITQIPAQQVLAVSRRVPMSDIAAAMGEAFDLLVRHAAATGAQFTGAPFSMYPEMPREVVSFLVCMPVAPGAVAGEGVELQELPAAEAATLVYKGPYDAMEPTWRRLMDWVANSDRQPGGPPREVYLNDPEEVAPEDLLTQLIVPLA